MPRLVLLTPAELTRDPRARRTAEAARAAGWDVTGVCVAAGGAPTPLEGTDVIRVGGEELDGHLRAAGLGAGRQDGRVVRELRGLYRMLRLVARTIAMTRAVDRLPGFDVVHANDLDTLPAAAIAARRRRARLVYDSHELYALQEVDPPKLQRAAMLALERALARRADTVITVSEPIAGELQTLLRLPHRPLVVLNTPSISGEVSSEEVGRPLRAIYQGAVGLSRSLDDLLDAARALRDVTLTLRISGIDTDSLRGEIDRRGLGGSVEVREPVDPGSLVEALVEFDVGIVATRPLTQNDRLAAPNKLFEYMMAGLAVVVPDASGSAEIVRRENVGTTFAAGSTSALGSTLNALAAEPERVAAWKARARAAARGRLNAEAQRPVLMEAWGA